MLSQAACPTPSPPLQRVSSSRQATPPLPLRPWEVCPPGADVTLKPKCDVVGKCFPHFRKITSNRFWVDTLKGGRGDRTKTSVLKRTPGVADIAQPPKGVGRFWDQSLEPSALVSALGGSGPEARVWLLTPIFFWFILEDGGGSLAACVGGDPSPPGKNSLVSPPLLCRHPEEYTRTRLSSTHR